MSPAKNHYRSLSISDIHLGTRGCKADELVDFLKHNSCDNLFLIGDIFDGWRLEKRWYFPQSHVNVVRKVLSFAKRGTNVYYILGNHDEVIRKFLTFYITIGHIRVLNQYDYIGGNGKKYLMIHGDVFDGLMIPSKKWIMHLGDVLYNFLVWFNTHLNAVRKILGLPYWSLSKFLKAKTKGAVNYIHGFEAQVAAHCNNKGYDGVVCGHIHTAEIKQLNDVLYMNDGDFCESCSALAEAQCGAFFLLVLQSGKYIPIQATTSDGSQILTGEAAVEYYISLGFTIQQAVDNPTN